MAVGFPAKTTYADGDVFSASDINDTNGTLNLLTSAQYAAGKNKIINGDFGIWQRGTSFSNVAALYVADRWFAQSDVTPTSSTISRQTFTPGTAPVAGYEGATFLQSLVTTAGSCTLYQWFQRIEDVRTFAGQTVTMSFWAKADTNGRIIQNIGIGQNFGSGGSAFVGTYGSNITLTTSWVRYSRTIAVPSISGKTIGTSSSLEFVFQQPVVSGASLSIWGVQLEAGSTATAFQTATGTVQGELTACQRYFQKSYQQTDSPGAVTSAGVNRFRATTNTGQFVLETMQRFIVPMRVSPTFTWYSTAGTSGKITNNGSDLTVSATYDYSSTVSPYAFTASSISAGNDVMYHFTASAEL